MKFETGKLNEKLLSHFHYG